MGRVSKVIAYNTAAVWSGLLRRWVLFSIFVILFSSVRNKTLVVQGMGVLRFAFREMRLRPKPGERRRPLPTFRRGVSGLVFRKRLAAIEECNGLRRLGGRREDCALVMAEHREPMREILGVIETRRAGNLKVGAEKRRA